MLWRWLLDIVKMLISQHSIFRPSSYQCSKSSSNTLASQVLPCRLFVIVDTLEVICLFECSHSSISCSWRCHICCNLAFRKSQRKSVLRYVSTRRRNQPEYVPTCIDLEMPGLLEVTKGEEGLLRCTLHTGGRRITQHFGRQHPSIVSSISPVSCTIDISPSLVEGPNLDLVS